MNGRRTSIIIVLAAFALTAIGAYCLNCRNVAEENRVAKAKEEADFKLVEQYLGEYILFSKRVDEILTLSEKRHLSDAEFDAVTDFQRSAVISFAKSTAIMSELRPEQVDDTDGALSSLVSDMAEDNIRPTDLLKVTPGGKGKGLTQKQLENFCNCLGLALNEVPQKENINEDELGPPSQTTSV